MADDSWRSTITHSLHHKHKTCIIKSAKVIYGHHLIFSSEGARGNDGHEFLIPPTIHLVQYRMSRDLICRFRTFLFWFEKVDTFLFMNNGFELIVPEINFPFSIMLLM